MPDTLTHLETRQHPVDLLPLLACVLCTEEDNQGVLYIFDCLVHLLSPRSNSKRFKVGVQDNPREQCWGPVTFSEQNAKQPLLLCCIFFLGGLILSPLSVFFFCVTVFFSVILPMSACKGCSMHLQGTPHSKIS